MNRKQGRLNNGQRGEMKGNKNGDGYSLYGRIKEAKYTLVQLSYSNTPPICKLIFKIYYSEKAGRQLFMRNPTHFVAKYSDCNGAVSSCRQNGPHIYHGADLTVRRHRISSEWDFTREGPTSPD